MMTSMNKRIHFFIKIYLTLYFRKGDICCVREMSGDKDGLLYWPSSSSTIAALLSQSGLCCSTVGHWGPKALCLELVLKSASCLPLTRTAGHLVILFSNAHLHQLFFRLFTQVNILIYDSVEGQYITLYNYLPCFIMRNIIFIFYWENFLFSFSTFTRSCVHWIAHLLGDSHSSMWWSGSFWPHFPHISLPLQESSWCLYFLHL